MNLQEHLPQGASYELRGTRTHTGSVRFDGNRFERIDSADQLSRTVRLLKDGKLSTASSSKPDSDLALVKKAGAMVNYGSPHNVPFVGETEIQDMDLIDETTLDSKQMIDMMGGLVADLRSIDDRLVVSASLTALKSDISLQTSLGFDHSYRKSVWTCSASAELMQGDDLLALYEWQASKSPDFDLKQIKADLEKQLNYAKNVVPFTPGAYPVIFDPFEVGNIVNPFVASLNGMAVYRQVSPWGDKLGQQLIDPRITLVDDGSIQGAWTSDPFDAEGTPTRRNELVQQGRPNSLILDRKTAALLGKESSGNGGGSMPLPRHLRLSPGDKSLEEMIASIDYGILISGTMGAWTGNPYTGIVSGTISMGLKIEKGKIVGRVKDCMFTVNAFEHFNNHLLGLSSDTKQSYSGRFPYVFLDEVVISAK